MEQKQKRAAEQAKQRQNSLSDDSNDATEHKQLSAVALTSFALDADSYELRDTWILDSGANSHICNNAKRFKFERMTMEGERLVAGKSWYPIEAFGSVTVAIKSPKALKYKCTFSKCTPKQSNICKFDGVFELKIHPNVRTEVDMILSLFVVG